MTDSNDSRDVTKMSHSELRDEFEEILTELQDSVPDERENQLYDRRTAVWNQMIRRLNRSTSTSKWTPAITKKQLKHTVSTQATTRQRTFRAHEHEQPLDSPVRIHLRPSL